MKPSGIIFDMDDTLVATAALWQRAENHLLHLLGSKWSVELAIQYKGMNVLDVAATIHRLLSPPNSLEYCQETLRTALFEAFSESPPRPMPGAVECVRRLAALAPLALASGSPLPLIHSVIKNLGLESEFKVLLSSESVLRGKPHPDVFLAAANSLGVAPGKCLVLEDSYVGVQAANAAGMVCFAIPSSHSKNISEAAQASFALLDEIDEAAVAVAFRSGSVLGERSHI